jgi:tetratricopeptide (TPR) repeat protein
LLVTLKLNEIDGARELIEKYQVEYPEVSFVKSAAAYYYFAQKNLVEAEKLAREAIELNAEDADALFIMSRIFFEQKKYAAAKWVLKNALEIMPSQGSLYLWLGHTDKISGLMHDALDAYSMAVKYEPTPEALESYGLLLLEQGQAKLALTILERLAKSRPLDFRNHLHLGNALMANKQYEAANIEYLKVLELNPNDKDTYFNLGMLYYDQKPKEMAELERLKTAENYFKTYLEQTGLSKDRVNEVKEYLNKISQKIELEEYKKEAEAESIQSQEKIEENAQDKNIKEEHPKLEPNSAESKKELKNLKELEDHNKEEKPKREQPEEKDIPLSNEEESPIDESIDIDNP